MSRKLPTRPNLDHLKREAKRLLRQARNSDQQAVRERMRRHVEREIDAGRELPTPEALRDAVGP